MGGQNMFFDAVSTMQFKREIERVLHVQGNYQGGILEMAMVFDGSMDMKLMQDIVKEAIPILKNSSEIFRNVRLNVIFYFGQTKITSTVVPMPFLIMGNYFQEKQQEWKRIVTEGISMKNVSMKKFSMDALLAYLKMYQARSKLILFVKSAELKVDDKKRAMESLNPFLKHKMILLEEHEGKLQICSGIRYELEQCIRE